MNQIKFDLCEEEEEEIFFRPRQSEAETTHVHWQCNKLLANLASCSQRHPVHVLLTEPTNVRPQMGVTDHYLILLPWAIPPWPPLPATIGWLRRHGSAGAASRSGASSIGRLQRWERLEPLVPPVGAMGERCGEVGERCGEVGRDFFSIVCQVFLQWKY